MAKTLIKPGKQIIVDAIIKEIEKGKTTDKICAVICNKFQFSARTFYNHLKIASEQHVAKQKLIKNKLIAVDTEAAIQSRKKAIMSADERKELLTSIANGTLKIKKIFIIAGKIKEHPALPDHTDRRNAIAELNKMDGSYAPTKVAPTDAEGNSLPSVTLSLPKGVNFELPSNTDGESVD